ncbi:FlxA-like family protein [Aquabacterium sp.]|uniref:FlxA-like family protein n=1 Tax=Aquabacterium sp. TaxID=1872578 RepID=UPI0035AE3601
MVSTVSSTQSVSAVGASNSIAKIAELNKQASTLRQQLLRARRSSGEGDEQASPDADKTESLSREIVNVQAQIEQLVLEAQLSRLNVAGATKTDDGGDHAASTSGDASGGGKTPKSGHGANHGSRVSEAYKPGFDAAGQLVNVQA